MSPFTENTSTENKSFCPPGAPSIMQQERRADASRPLDNVFFTPENTLFRRLCSARTNSAKINFPLGTTKFVLLYLILARQTVSHQTATSIYFYPPRKTKNQTIKKPLVRYFILLTTCTPSPPRTHTLLHPS